MKSLTLILFILITCQIAHSQDGNAGENFMQGYRLVLLARGDNVAAKDTDTYSVAVRLKKEDYQNRNVVDSIRLVVISQYSNHAICQRYNILRIKIKGGCFRRKVFKYEIKDQSIIKEVSQSVIIKPKYKL